MNYVETQDIQNVDITELEMVNASRKPVELRFVDLENSGTGDRSQTKMDVIVDVEPVGEGNMEDGEIKVVMKPMIPGT